MTRYQHWAESYIGRPYVEGVHDCADFVVAVMREHFGRELTLPAHGAGTRAWDRQIAALKGVYAVHVAPEARGTMGAPEARGTMGAPEARGTMGAPEARGTMGAPEARGTMGAPEARGTMGAPEARGTMGAPEARGTMGAPEARGTMGTPREGDGVLMAAAARRRSVGHRIGIWCAVGGEPYVLHCLKGVGSILHPIRDLDRRALVLEGVYRWR